MRFDKHGNPNLSRPTTLRCRLFGHKANPPIRKTWRTCRRCGVQWQEQER